MDLIMRRRWKVTTTWRDGSRHRAHRHASGATNFKRARFARRGPPSVFRSSHLEESPADAPRCVFNVLFYLDMEDSTRLSKHDSSFHSTLYYCCHIVSERVLQLLEHQDLYSSDLPEFTRLGLILIPYNQGDAKLFW
jgi:hypothetical protein